MAKMIDLVSKYFEGENAQAPAMIEGTQVMNGSVGGNQATGQFTFITGLVKPLMIIRRMLANGPEPKVTKAGDETTVEFRNYLLIFRESTGELLLNHENAGGMLPLVAISVSDIKAVDLAKPAILANDLVQMKYGVWHSWAMANRGSLDMVTVDDTLSKYGDVNAYRLTDDSVWGDEALQNVRFNQEKHGFVDIDDMIVSLVKWYHHEDCSMLSGPTGTGKTTVYAKVSALLNLPFYVQNFDKDTDPDKILGQPYPNPNGEGFIFVESPFLKAFKYGGFYLGDEINFANGEVTAVFHSALDGQAQITLPTGEVVKKHPLFRMGAGINEEYAGTKPMNVAFLRRMKRKNRIQSMSKELLVERALVKFESDVRNGSITQEVIEKMAETVKKIESKYTNDMVRDASISISHLYYCIRMYVITKDWLSSAEATLVNLSCENAEVNQEVFENIVKAVTI